MHRFAKAIFNLETLFKPANGVAALVGASFAPFLEALLSSGKFWAFLLFIAIVTGDWISGTAAAKKTNTYSSEYGISGVFRTLLLLWIPFIGLLLDKVTFYVFGVDQPGWAFYGLTLMLSYHSWESMTANAYRAGWKKWIPKSVVQFVSSEIKAKADRASKLGSGKQ